MSKQIASLTFASISKVTILLLSVGLVACHNHPEDYNLPNTNIYGYIGVFYDNFQQTDRSIVINAQHSFSAFSEEGSSVDLAIYSNFSNAGMVYLNSIALDEDYQKNYGVDTLDDMYTDAASLFSGDEVHLYNADCNSGDFCGMDYQFSVPPLLELSINGVVDRKVNASDGIDILWNAEGDEDDVMVVSLIRYSDEETERPTQIVSKKFLNAAGSITFSGNELDDIFDDGDLVYIQIARGRQHVYTLDNNKTVSIVSSDMLNYVGLIFEE